MIKNIYLTIDDGPSKNTKKKIDFLKKLNIPAIFFCRGEFISNQKDVLIYAIKNGFLLGNHSYSHVKFSKLSFSECCNEILRTEKLLDSCYLEANVIRNIKSVRFPFGDKGSVENISLLQEFLKKEKFLSPTFNQDNFIDAFWTWDTMDYKRSMIENEKEYETCLAKYFKKSAETEVILLHDFEDNKNLFDLTMHFLLKKNVNFLPLKFKNS